MVNSLMGSSVCFLLVNSADIYADGRFTDNVL